MTLVVISTAFSQEFDLMSVHSTDKLATSCFFVVTSQGTNLYRNTTLSQPTSTTTDDTLYVVTSPTTTSVKNESIPAQNSLSQNYPNPFNNSTVIRYDIASPGIVTLTVYDITGREVSRLVNDQKQMGQFSIGFSNEHLATGTYIYRMMVTTSDGATTVNTNKMTVIK